MTSILVVGAGELGTCVLKALATAAKRPKDTRLTVLLRQETIASSDATKIRALDEFRELGIYVQPGDFLRAGVTELAAVFGAYDVVIQCAGYGMPKGTQPKITQAAIDAKVPRFLPWQFGLDFDAIPEGSFSGFFDDNKQVRRMLREQSNTKFFIVSTGLFMSYLFLSEFGVVDIKNRTARALGSWDNKTTLTLPDDIGMMVAEVVYDPPKGDLTGSVYISGDTISYEKLVSLLERKFGGTFTRELWDARTLEEAWKDDPENLWKKYRFVFATGLGTFWEKEQSFNHKRQLGLTSLEDYVEENLAAILGQ